MAKHTKVYYQHRLVYKDNRIFRFLRITFLIARRRRINKKLLEMGVMEVLKDGMYQTLQEYEEDQAKKEPEGKL